MTRSGLRSATRTHLPGSRTGRRSEPPTHASSPPMSGDVLDATSTRLSASWNSPSSRGELRASYDDSSASARLRPLPLGRTRSDDHRSAARLSTGPSRQRRTDVAGHGRGGLVAAMYDPDPGQLLHRPGRGRPGPGRATPVVWTATPQGPGLRPAHRPTGDQLCRSQRYRQPRRYDAMALSCRPTNPLWPDESTGAHLRLLADHGRAGSAAT